MFAVALKIEQGNLLNKIIMIKYKPVIRGLKRVLIYCIHIEIRAIFSYLIAQRITIDLVREKLLQMLHFLMKSLSETQSWTQ